MPSYSVVFTSLSALPVVYFSKVHGILQSDNTEEWPYHWHHITWPGIVLDLT